MVVWAWVVESRGPWEHGRIRTHHHGAHLHDHEQLDVLGVLEEEVGEALAPHSQRQM